MYIYLKYFHLSIILIIVIVLFLLLLIEMIWITSGARKKRRTGKRSRVFFSKLTSVLLSLLFIVGSIYASIGDNFINNITSAFMQTRIIAIYAMKDSNIKNVDDLKGKTFGIENNKSISEITNALAQIQDKLTRHQKKRIMMIMQNWLMRYMMKKLIVLLLINRI